MAVRCRWGLVVLLMGCRDYQDPLPFTDCQPYALECADCTLEDDVADQAGLERVHRCEAEDGDRLDAVVREGVSDAGDPTTDIRYYDADDGLRVASERRHRADVEVCDVTTDVEWWGVILGDCIPVCEWGDMLPGADPELPLCP